MTIHLTMPQAALLASAAARIGEFCQKSPNTAALLRLNSQKARELQKIAQKIAEQTQENLKKQIEP